MTTGLYAIGSMFAGTASAGPAASKPPPDKTSSQLFSIRDEHPLRADTLEPETADNVGKKNQNELADTSAQDFGRTLSREMRPAPSSGDAVGKRGPQISHQGQDRTKPSTQPSALAGGLAANSAQFTLVQKSGTARAILDKGAATLAQHTSSQKGGAGTLCKPVQPVNKLGLTGLKYVLADSPKGLIVANEQQEGAQNVDGKLKPNPNAVAAGGLTRENCSPKTAHSTSCAKRIAEAVTARSQATPAGEKPIAADTKAGNIGQRTRVADDPFATVQGRNSHGQENTAVGPKKSALPVDKPVDNKVIAGQILSGFASGKGQVNGHTAKTHLGQLNAAEFNISAGQMKDRSRATSNKGSTTAFVQAFTSSNSQIQRSELPPVSTQTTKAASNSLPSDVSGTISEQIMESIRGPIQHADKYITIRLHPPELGEVLLRFQEQEEQITGLLEVTKAETRYEIEQALPQIVRTLQNSGVQINRVEVLLTDQLERQADRYELTQDGSSQQHRFPEGGNPDHESAYEWLTNTPESSYQDSYEPQIVLTENSISILI